MPAQTDAPSIADPDESDDPDRVLRFAAALYGGLLFAGVVSITLLASTPIGPRPPSVTVLASTYVGGLLFGAVLGAVIASRDRVLPARLGRTARRRFLPILPVLPFGALVAASWWGPIGDAAATVALGTAAALSLTGYVLARVAQSRYVERVTADEPIAAWRWTPPNAHKLDAAIIALFLFLAVGNAFSGDWVLAGGWLFVAVFWVISAVEEGRWQVGAGSTTEIRVHDAGLVKRRPYTRSLVPWETIDRVRLREGELVLDRGLFDVRFDREELADPEAALETIERRLSNVDSRGVASG
ncbi:hypothetical protein ACFO5R_02135 [Halosolutus amylolyticus]|uniref:PH domain-containing protein n=1 Tax=Halosolutus amylolyticus TaxID=2932267 RepID=A0ABD5PK59_9EURY|nr:hypothetical protein [Halosolutus amylolyticus]